VKIVITIIGLVFTFSTANLAFADVEKINANCDIDTLVLIDSGQRNALQTGSLTALEIPMTKIAPNRDEYEGYAETVLKGQGYDGKGNIIDIYNDGQHKIAVSPRLEQFSTGLKILSLRVVMLEKNSDGSYSAVANNFTDSHGIRQYRTGKLIAELKMNDYRSADIRLKLGKIPIRLEAEEPASRNRDIEEAMEKGLIPKNYLSYLRVQCSINN
jgi:hypothetical protein